MHCGSRLQCAAHLSWLSVKQLNADLIFMLYTKVIFIWCSGGRDSRSDPVFPVTAWRLDLISVKPCVEKPVYAMVTLCFRKSLAVINAKYAPHLQAAFRVDAPDVQTCQAMGSITKYAFSVKWIWRQACSHLMRFDTAGSADVSGTGQFGRVGED